MVTQSQISYRDAGVDIAEADRAIASIKKLARATFTRGVLTEIGSFGACYALPKMRQPVLISSVDGVGTKLKIAFLTGKHGTIGEDLVNHCVNDIAVQGATPLFFLDYFAVGKLDAQVAVAIVSGMARGCRANGCALIGGETAEMPGLYADGEYDLAGTIVGAAEKSQVITGAKVRAGDVLIGLPSTGLHTNGYSLARKLLFETAGYKVDTRLPELGALSGGTLGDELLKVHRSYLRPIQALTRAGLLHAAAHITGGGITDNTPRVLPKGLAASIDVSSWTVPPIFEILRGIGNIPLDDYRRTFNLGVGLILVVPETRVDSARRALKRIGEAPFVIGSVVPQKRGRARVEYR
ncbi:MAG: phosphoribosylformylglycinamidine cyclo-ligase [Acidobacteriota bacterium]|nr:phosphoribosylformylglycinamidine cyclo-ligase [Acidobacteriota bacterium]